MPDLRPQGGRRPRHAVTRSPRHLVTPMPYRVLFVVFLAACAPGGAGDVRAIHLNQIGFYPGMEKLAVVVGAEGGAFQVVPESGGAPAFTGELGPELGSEVWGEPARVADFSPLRTIGSFRLVVPGVGE